ncbi:MAG: hypothetical protein K0R61_2962 [Microvirga sp.]|jgi:hypothetical protein|nr:hypothetical protein [Microvirga sp.]
MVERCEAGLFATESDFVAHTLWLIWFYSSAAAFCGDC